MNAFQRLLLSVLGKGLAGVHWQALIDQVEDLAAINITNAERWEKAKYFLRDNGCKLAGFMLNLLVELAVAYAASQGLIKDPS